MNVRDTLAFGLATWFGVGRFAYGPGTLASIVVVPVWMGLSWLVPAWGYGLVWCAVLLVGWWSTEVVLDRLKQHDPQMVVIDEVLGCGLALWGVPLHLGWVLLSVFLFRLLDIWKPGPIRWCERIPGAWGVLLDDVVAGALVCFCLWTIRAVGSG